MADINFFSPTAAPANRPTQGIGAPLVAGARAAAEARARAGANLLGVVENISQRRHERGVLAQKRSDLAEARGAEVLDKAATRSQELADKLQLREDTANGFNDLADLLTGGETFETIEVIDADNSDVITGARMRAAQQGFAPGPQTQSFVVNELVRLNPHMSQADASRALSELNTPRSVRVSTPEGQGQIARQVGVLVGLNADTSMIRNTFERLSGDAESNQEGVRLASRERASKAFRNDVVSAATAQTFGQTVGGARGRSGPDTAAANEAARTSKELDRIADQDTDAALTRTAAAAVVFEDGQAKTITGIVNSTRAKLKAEESVQTERTEKMLEAGKYMQTVINQQARVQRVAPVKGDAPLEMAELRSVAERYAGTPEGDEALAIVERTDLGLNSSKRLVLQDPRGVIEGAMERFPSLTLEQAQSLLQDSLGRDVMTSDESIQATKAFLSSRAKELTQSAQKRESSGGNIDDTTLLLGVESFADTNAKLQNSRGSLSTGLRVSKEEREAFVRQFQKTPEGKGSNTTLLNNVNFSMALTQDGVQLVSESGPEAQAFLDFLETRPELNERVLDRAGRLGSSGNARNLSPRDQQAFLAANIKRAQAAGAATTTPGAEEAPGKLGVDDFAAGADGIK